MDDDIGRSNHRNLQAVLLEKYWVRGTSNPKLFRNPVMDSVQRDRRSASGGGSTVSEIDVARRMSILMGRGDEVTDTFRSLLSAVVSGDRLFNITQLDVFTRALDLTYPQWQELWLALKCDIEDQSTRDRRSRSADTITALARAAGDNYLREFARVICGDTTFLEVLAAEKEFPRLGDALQVLMPAIPSLLALRHDHPTVSWQIGELSRTAMHPFQTRGDYRSRRGVSRFGADRGKSLNTAAGERIAAEQLTDGLLFSLFYPRPKRHPDLDEAWKVYEEVLALAQHAKYLEMVALAKAFGACLALKATDRNLLDADRCVHEAHRALDECASGSGIRDLIESRVLWAEAKTHLWRGEPQKGITKCKLAIDAWERFAKNRYGMLATLEMGWCYLDMGSAAPGDQAFGEVVKMCSAIGEYPDEQAQAWYGRGCAAILSGRFHEVETHFAIAEQLLRPLALAQDPDTVPEEDFWVLAQIDYVRKQLAHPTNDWHRIPRTWMLRLA